MSEVCGAVKVREKIFLPFISCLIVGHFVPFAVDGMPETVSKTEKQNKYRRGDCQCQTENNTLMCVRPGSNIPPIQGDQLQ
jgi:hypothetical protein